MRGDTGNDNRYLMILLYISLLGKYLHDKQSVANFEINYVF